MITMTGSETEIRSRLKKFQQLISEEEGKAIFLTPGDNFFYLSGFDTDSMERLLVAVVTPEEAVMISPLMLEDQIKESPWPGEIITWRDGEDPFRYVQNVIREYKITNLEIERNLSYYTYSEMKRLGIKKFHLADDRFSLERLVKSKSEIESIQTAIRRSEASYTDALKEIRKGMTEIELAGILDYQFTRHSLQKVAFGSIVAFGENSASPHHVPSKRRLKPGDIVLMDFGGKYNGYSSDTTRTCAFDSLTPEMRKVYAIVREAQEKSLEGITRESRYSSVDRTARSIISKAGYGEFFTHRLGHGLGIAVHEEPYLTSANKKTVQNRTVFTIEPGIYLKGKGGVRIEDTVMFDGKVARPFNRLTKELIII
jgi:Xaa-Pro dipeptidase